jgi:hypothetical protein
MDWEVMVLKQLVEYGISRRAIAELMNVSPSTVNRIADGTYRASVGAARSDIPALIAEVRRLNALLSKTVPVLPADDDADSRIDALVAANKPKPKPLSDATARIKELECAIRVVYDGLSDANEDPYVAGEDTARDVLGRVMPKDIFYVDASDTRMVPSGIAPSQSLEIKVDKRPTWDYDDELLAFVCHYSPRSDYRLVVSLMNERGYSYDANVEWLEGGSDWVGEFYDLGDAQEAAIAWAKKYEEQR